MEPMVASSWGSAWSGRVSTHPSSFLSRSSSLRCCVEIELVVVDVGDQFVRIEVLSDERRYRVET